MWSQWTNVSVYHGNWNTFFRKHKRTPVLCSLSIFSLFPCFHLVLRRFFFLVINSQVVSTKWNGGKWCGNWCNIQLLALLQEKIITLINLSSIIIGWILTLSEPASLQTSPNISVYFTMSFCCLPHVYGFMFNST